MSISLLRVLIKELEKAERTDCKIRIIPLLHTLAYAVIQSAYIPDELCERIYVCLKRLVALPEPYCSVGLNYAKQMKIEHNIPGALYQRRVIAEHSLKNDHYPLHERVFVFADPAMFTETMLKALRADVECGALDWATLTPQRQVLLHTLQAGLGRECHGRQLTQSLEDLGADIEKYFQDVVCIVEERIVDGGSECDLYNERLQQLYDEIICSSSTEQSCPVSLVGNPLPSPEVSFHVWTKEDEIWNEVINFTLMLSSTNETSAFLEDGQDSRRASVISTISRDSGIEGDLPLNEFSFLMVEPSGGLEVQDPQKSLPFSRRPCVRWPKAANRMTLMMEAIKESGGTGGSGSSILKEEKNFTARAVVLGDDSTLGRLAKAYHNIRKKEMRNLFLTKRVNLEIYYIPVTSQSNAASPVQENATANVDRLTLAASLGSMDPWYDSNINSLGAMMLKLAETHSSVSGSSEPNSFLLDIISYYTRTAQQPVNIPIYTVKASISNREVDKRMPLTISGVSIRAASPSGTKSLESLSVDFRDPNPTRPPMGAAMKRSKQWDIRGAVGFAALFHFLYACAIGCLLPFLTLYLRHLGLTAFMTGTIMAVKHIVALVWRPLSCILARRHNKRRTVIIEHKMRPAQEHNNTERISAMPVNISALRNTQSTTEATTSSQSDRQKSSEVHMPSPGKRRRSLRKREQKQQEIQYEFLGSLKVMDTQHQMFFLIMIIIILWEFLAAPLTWAADDGLHEYLDFVDATERHRAIKPWRLLGIAGGMGCSGILVSFLYCLIGTVLHFYTYALLMVLAMPLAALLPLYRHKREHVPGAGLKALHLVRRDSQALLCAITAVLTGMAGSAVSDFLLWQMQDLNATELQMGITLAVVPLCQAAFAPLNGCLTRLLKFHGRLLPLGILGLSLQCLSYSFIQIPWTVLPSQLLAGISIGALWWSLEAQSADVASPGIELAVKRVFEALCLDLGAGLGSVAAGFVVQKFGIKVLFQGTAAMLGLWCITLAVLQWRIPRQRRINYSRLLAADASEMSESESEQDNDWLEKAIEEDKGNNNWRRLD
ncbi:hypothetical protein QTP86_006071 [Hemibagrus guttatus]|nr:hypothetical protein QTP86_006071 [Hemibagrus guttatus]